MSFLTTLALRRKPVTIMVMGLLLAVGLYSYDSLHQELFPEISFAIVYVITPYQQGDPNTVASEVTEKIENVIIGMADLDKITSVSSSSVSSITATFTTGADTEKAEEEIRANVGALDLPDDALNPRCGSRNVGYIPRDVAERQRRPGHTIAATSDRRRDTSPTGSG